MGISEQITVVPAAVRSTDVGPTTAVLVLPGGGYAGHASHEAEVVAHWLSSAGWHAFVLRYPVSPEEPSAALHPAPLTAAVEAMRWIRSGAHGLDIAPHAVGVLGFSAGGHLAASLSHAATLLDAPDAVPDFAVLGYPVVSLVHEPHLGSTRRLLGPDPDPELLDALSLANQVTASTPPTFLWHTAADAGVPVSHSLGYAEALAAHHVPFELHIFPDGPHGLGLGYSDPTVRHWTALCEDWIRRRTA